MCVLSIRYLEFNIIHNRTNTFGRGRDDFLQNKFNELINCYFFIPTQSRKSFRRIQFFVNSFLKKETRLYGLVYWYLLY